MAVKKLEIHGYRSLREATWCPGSLNLIVGPNGSGKSNLLEMLALISKCADGRLGKSIEDSGGVVPLLWDHQPGSFGWKATLDSGIEKRPKRESTFELTVGQIGRGSAYKIVLDAYINWNDPDKEFGPSENTGFIRRESGDPLFRSFVKGEIQDRELSGVIDSESYVKELAWKECNDIRSWRIHHYIDVGPGSSIRLPSTTQYVTSLEAGGQNLLPVLHTLYTGSREFKELIDDGMRAGFGDEYEQLVFQPAAAQQIQLAVQWKSSSEPHAGQDLSDGTLRFLSLLTTLSLPEPPPLVALEEPDVGLHPTMLSIVAEYAQTASERTQVIITTHSPDFLDAFSAMSPSVTLCDWSDGQTHLYTLDSDRLDRWLEKYRLGHLFTSGELEALALPDVEPVENGADQTDELQAEDAALSEIADDSADSADG